MFPGSFNPPTVAHLAIAQAAVTQLALDRLDLSLSRVALAKEGVTRPPFADRVEVVAASVAEVAKVEVRVTEAQLIAEIARDYDVVVLGADKWSQIQQEHWYGSPQARDAVMATLPRLAVFPRGDLAVPSSIRLDLSGFEEVSSSRAREGDWTVMTPEAALYAAENGGWG